MGVICSISTDKNYSQRNVKASILDRSNPFALANRNDNKVEIYSANPKPAESLMLNPFEYLYLKQNGKLNSKFNSCPQKEVLQIQYAPKLHKGEADGGLRTTLVNLSDSSKVCDICLDTSSQDDFGALESCDHTFHTLCMKSYLNWARTYRNLPIKCPDTKCEKYLTFNDIEHFLSGQDLMNYYEVWTALNRKEIIPCQTPGCHRALVLNGENHIYCIGCFGHVNLSGSSDKEFISFAAANNFRQCSQCKCWVEKSVGCVHMTCRCKYQFCYECGSKWRTCTCS